MAKTVSRDRPAEPPIHKSKSQTVPAAVVTTSVAPSSNRARKPANVAKDLSTPQNNSSAVTPSISSNPQAGQVAPLHTSPWSAAPLPVLHSYRSLHRLKTPSSFSNPHSYHILAHGIGRQSPTAAGIRKEMRRIQREGLSMAVRKHFNASVVNENDAIVNTLYKARTSEKSLRLKFLPASKQR